METPPASTVLPAHLPPPCQACLIQQALLLCLGILNAWLLCWCRRAAQLFMRSNTCRLVICEKHNLLARRHDLLHFRCWLLMHRGVQGTRATDEHPQIEEVPVVEEKNAHHHCVCMVCFQRQNEMPGDVRCALVISSLQTGQKYSSSSTTVRYDIIRTIETSFVGPNRALLGQQL